MAIAFAGFQAIQGAQLSELQSRHFRGTPSLEAALNHDPAHILPGDDGFHVRLIQEALKELDNLSIDARELAEMRYGPSTAEAVLKFKRKRNILNFRNQLDNIVGKKTMAALDGEMFEKERRAVEERSVIIQKAFEQSRESVRNVTRILQQLEADIERADRADGIEKILAIANLGRLHERNIAVISRRLNVDLNPLSPGFRSALQKARELLQQNLSESSTFIEEGVTGRCTFNPGDSTPWAAATKSDPDPRVSICPRFFQANADLQRDVITHEFFHLVGLADVNNPITTSDSLNSANTLAQIVAYLNDRRRQQNSDGKEPAIPLLPMP